MEKDIKKLQEQENTTEEEYNKSLDELLDDRLREVEFENDDKLELTQTDEFQEGLSKALYYAGFYNGLRNYGMNSNDAYNMTLNEHTCNHNLELAKVQDEQNKNLDNTNVMGFQYTSNDEYEDDEE